ncbi:MAG: SPOR domain-containing protein [Methylophaga sp.]|nr:SPOR domain-containing protein [Methylophaga sp.]
MTPIQQQRLVGAGLLVLLVAVLVYVVLSKVGQHQTKQTLELPEPIEFSSIIEPIDDGAETVQGEKEAMVDADLPQTTTAQNIVIADNNTEVTKIEVKAAKSTASPAVETTTSEAAVSNADNPMAVSEPNAAAPNTSGDRWLIQLGSFAVQNNAQTLKAKAEKLGYKPYIENSQTDKGPIYRVRLPKIANRAQADDIAARINAQLNIKTQVSKQ